MAGPRIRSARMAPLVGAAVLLANPLGCSARSRAVTPGGASAPPSSESSRSTPSVQRRQERLQGVLDSYAAANGFPGAVLATWFSDGEVVSVAAGLADRDQRTAMSVDSRMLAGSVGKTFFAALAMQLTGEGRLSLDAPVARYLGREPWFGSLPNGDLVTVRMLLNHTSGYGSYDEAFMRQLAEQPLRERDHLELLEPLFRNRPVAEPGKRFAYSDLNYVLLAQLMESVTRGPACGEIDRRFLRVLGLHDTAPAKSPRIPGLVPGYAGAANPFGDKMLRDGAVVVNPQFEWAGGGYVSTAPDLARWMAAFCGGKAFPSRLWTDVVAGVAAPSLGEGARYGLGIVIQPTRAGTAYGHGGFFPGYVSWVRWYPEAGLAVAIQVNSSDDAAFKRGVRDALDEAAVALARM